MKIFDVDTVGRIRLSLDSSSTIPLGRLRWRTIQFGWSEAEENALWPMWHGDFFVTRTRYSNSEPVSRKR